MILSSDIKILSTGNPNKDGLAKQLSLEFPQSYFLHQSMGVDLTTDQGQDYFRSIVNDYDVFVNLSNIKNNIQEKLLRIAHEAGMKGHVFNIGSIAEYRRWEWYDQNYTDEKRKLRELSLELCSESFKTTHIIVGGFQDAQDNSPSRMDPIEIVKMIKYILESPISIPIVGIEKIIDKEMKEILNGKL